jgi:hypothetical protein
VYKKGKTKEHVFEYDRKGQKGGMYGEEKVEYICARHVFDHLKPIEKVSMTGFVFSLPEEANSPYHNRPHK